MGEELGDLATRSLWTVVDSVTKYDPTPGWWRGCSRPVLMAEQAHERLHVTLIDAKGCARHVSKSTSAPEAAWVAEGLHRWLIQREAVTSS